MDLQGKTICFLGDSITEGCGASMADKCFVALFAATYSEARVLNYGISGTRIANQQKPLDMNIEHPFYSRVNGMTDSADVICVFGGTNDFGHGDAPMGELGDTTPDTFYGALYVLSENLKSRYPEAKIVFFTPLHREGENISSKRADGEWTLFDYVKAIRENAANFSFSVLDLWDKIAINPTDTKQKTEFMPDGLHPNDKGHKILFDNIKSFIESDIT